MAALAAGAVAPSTTRCRHTGSTGRAVAVTTSLRRGPRVGSPTVHSAPPSIARTVGTVSDAVGRAMRQPPAGARPETARSPPMATSTPQRRGLGHRLGAALHRDRRQRRARGRGGGGGGGRGRSPGRRGRPGGGGRRRWPGRWSRRRGTGPRASACCGARPRRRRGDRGRTARSSSVSSRRNTSRASRSCHGSVSTTRQGTSHTRKSAPIVTVREPVCSWSVMGSLRSWARCGPDQVL